METILVIREMNSTHSKIEIVMEQIKISRKDYSLKEIENMLRIK